MFHFTVTELLLSASFDTNLDWSPTLSDTLGLGKITWQEVGRIESDMATKIYSGEERGVRKMMTRKRYPAH